MASKNSSQGAEEYTDSMAGEATGGASMLGPEQLEGLPEVRDMEGNVISFGPASAQVINWCAENSSVSDGDTAAAMEAMIARVLAAESPDEVLSEEMTVPVKDVLGIPLFITGVRIGETDFAEGFPFYALLDCEYGTPREKHVVTVGAFKVMAQIYALSKMAEWPQMVVFKESEKPTKAGFRPISLTRPKV